MLTKDDITAMKRSDTIVCHFSEDKRSFITAWQRRKDSVFNSDRSYREIQVDAQGISDKTIKCCSHIYIERVKDIIDLLKVGDSLTLSWYANGHTNQYCSDANLHSDTLTWIIQRRLKSGKYKTMRFLVDVSTCPNNTARMIQERV